MDEPGDVKAKPSVSPDVGESET